MASVCEPLVHAEAGVREEAISLERRKSERFRCNWYPTVSFLARTKTLATGRGVIRDVSRFGLGLISEHDLKPGTLLAIQLRSQQHGFSDVLSAKNRASRASETMARTCARGAATFTQLVRRRVGSHPNLRACEAPCIELLAGRFIA